MREESPGHGLQTKRNFLSIDNQGLEKAQRVKVRRGIQVNIKNKSLGLNVVCGQAMEGDQEMHVKAMWRKSTARGRK